MPRQPPRSPLFPYTTLFRSERIARQTLMLRELAELGMEIAREVRRQAVTPADPEDAAPGPPRFPGDRKSTRLNSSHTVISYAVFCLKKKNKIQPAVITGQNL